MVRALPFDITACYCCSAQRGQQNIANLGSKRTLALKHNTEEVMYLINIQDLKREIRRQADHYYLNVLKLFIF